MKTKIRQFAIAFAALLSMACITVHAGPGAHGPGGEHLDAPVASASAGAGAPRLEARSEAFELVATLRGGELSIVLDRFESNEPVLGAEVEVESGALRARARFQADRGDYAIDDPAFLKAVSAAGEHALVFTVLAGAEADLLDATLVVTPFARVDHEHVDGHGLEAQAYGWALAAMLGLSVATVVAWRWRHRTRAVANPAEGAKA